MSATWRFVGGWVLPPLCVLGLLFVPAKVPETFRAWRGHGQAGTLAVERVEFGKRCRYFGPWTSNDGTRKLPAAWVDDLNRDDCRYRAGSQIESLYVGNPTTVYVSGDYAFWFAIIISAAFTLYLLGFCLVVLRRRLE